MTLLYGMRRLHNVRDWEAIAERRHWRPGRSAYELAHKWLPATIPPSQVAQLLRSGPPVLESLRFELCVVEKPVVLDTLKGPSMTDLMAYARNQGGDRVVLAVEGKTDETFGLRVFSWIRGDKELQQPDGQPRPSRERRLLFLASQLGLSITADSRLRYQLLHRTASAILEAAQLGAAAAVVVIHSFAGEGADADNWKDFSEFLRLLGLSPSKGTLVGPVSLGSPIKVPVFFGWAADSPCEQAVQQANGADAPPA
jgi:hypothetical protein